MRIIDTRLITQTVEQLCIAANCNLAVDLRKAYVTAKETEKSELGQEILETIIENADTAKREQIAICQDTGMAVVFVEIGQQVVIEGGSLTRAINDGVRLGYNRGFLRKSVVNDPIERINTRDNAPAVIHYDIVSGDKLKIVVAPKGFGSENMGGLKMLKPSDGIDGVIDFVVSTVKAGGQNACPPLVIGVGVGGTMEKCAYLAKKALLRPIGEPSPLPFWKETEEKLLKLINELGIGPAGLGGSTTAVSVNIETFPTHIAGLPVAVNVGCHVTRHSEAEL